MTKISSILASALVAGVMILTTIVAPPTVAADTLPENFATSSGQCPSIASFDWLSWITESNSIFDYDNSSYVVFLDSVNYAAYSSNARPTYGDPGYGFTIYVNSQIGSKLTLDGSEYVPMTSGTHTKYHGKVFAGEVYNAGTGITAPGSIDVYSAVNYDWKPNPASNTTPQQYVGTGAHPAPFSVIDTHNYPYTTGYPFTGAGGREAGYVGNPSVGCVVAAHNVNYVNWNYAKPNSALAYTEGKASAGTASESCSTLNIGCYLAKAFQALSTEMATIMSAFWDSLVHMFVPDSIAIADIWTGFYDSFTDQLGLLYYPVDFATDFFGALADNSNAWCSSSSCTLDAGNFMGSDLRIDFLTLQNTIPGAWNTLVNVVRGSAVITLIFMIRRKALSMMGKGNDA